MVQRAIRLLAPIPTALVHALDLFIPSSRPLMLLRARNRYEGVHLEETRQFRSPKRRNHSQTANSVVPDGQREATTF